MTFHECKYMVELQILADESDHWRYFSDLSSLVVVELKELLDCKPQHLSAVPDNKVLL